MIDEVPLAPTERGSPVSRTMQLVGVGVYSARRGPALSGGGGVARYQRTPGSLRLTEGEVGRAISAMSSSASADLADLGDLLERVRGGAGLCSLMRENGTWVHPREKAVRYAIAVLTLAVRLGDARAETALVLLKNVQAQGETVE